MDILSLIVVLITILFFVLMFIWLIRGRKGSGAGTFMIMSGATDALMDKDKKRAVEMIVEQNAHKKMEEQGSSEPGIKKNNPQP